jgi:hypothetical protein
MTKPSDRANEVALSECPAAVAPAQPDNAQRSRNRSRLSCHVPVIHSADQIAIHGVARAGRMERPSSDPLHGWWTRRRSTGPRRVGERLDAVLTWVAVGAPTYYGCKIGLALAAREGRLLVTHDQSTMPHHPLPRHAHDGGSPDASAVRRELCPAPRARNPLLGRGARPLLADGWMNHCLRGRLQSDQLT